MLRSLVSVMTVCVVVMLTLSLKGDPIPTDLALFDVMQCETAADINVPPIATYIGDNGSNVVLITWDTGCDMYINGDFCDVTFRTTDEWGRPIFCGLQSTSGLSCFWLFDCDGNGGRMEQVEVGDESLLATRELFDPDSPQTVISKKKCVCENPSIEYDCARAIDCYKKYKCQSGGTHQFRCYWREVTPG